MRILVINWQDLSNPLSGGAEVHLHEVFSRIAKMGHEVTLLCSRHPGSREEEMLDGMRVLRHGNRGIFNYVVPALYRRMGKGRFDVVIEDLNKVPFFTPFFVRDPLLGIGHHLFRGSIFREVNPLAAAYVYSMESIAARLYARRRMPFIVNSPSTRDDFVGMGFRRDDISVVYLAVNHSLFRRTGVPKSPAPLIGAFGRLKKYKSVHHLLGALPRVLENVPDLKVVIAGEGDDRVRLQRIAADLRLEGVVNFTGFIPDEAKVRLLQEIWFKVACSVKEGWGLTVTEANACGTPVIASNVPGLRDAVRDGETGVLYPYGNIDALAGQMIRLLTDGQRRNTLAANAVSYAATFTWDRAAEMTMAFVERVVYKSGKQ